MVRETNHTDSVTISHMNSDATVTQFDPASTLSALDAVFAAVSAFRNTDAEELRRIERYIDADAISLLFGKPESSTTRIEEGSLSFRYDDVFVTVTHDGWIEVVDADAFRTRPVHYGLPVDASARQSTEATLEAAAAALAKAEGHIWTAASNASDDELVDPLWTAVGALWPLQASIDDLTAQSSSTDPLATGIDEQR